MDLFESGVRGQESVRLDLQFGGVECTAAEDMARQEYALSADIKYQVQRFGVGHPLQSGSVDFDNMDLTKAYAIVEQAQLAWLELPAVIRTRYKSWASVEAAAQSGELAQLLKTAGVEEVPSSIRAGSPSDSAGEGGTKGASKGDSPS